MSQLDINGLSGVVYKVKKTLVPAQSPVELHNYESVT